MSELRNEGPQRSPTLRYRGDGAGGNLGNLSWTPFAFAGAAVAGAATANHQRGRASDASNANMRYADGGIRDEDTPDGQTTQRYAGGGLAGPDSQYDSESGRAQESEYQSMHTDYQDTHTGYQYAGGGTSGGDGLLEPYRDLPLGSDGMTAGGGSGGGQGVTGVGGASIGPGGSGGFSPFDGLGVPAASGGTSDPNPGIAQGNSGSGLNRSGGPDIVPGLNQQDSYGNQQITPGGQQAAPGGEVSGDPGYNSSNPFGDLSYNPSLSDISGGGGGGGGQPGGDVSYPNQPSGQSQTDVPRPPYWSWGGQSAAPAYTSAPGGVSIPGDGTVGNNAPQSVDEMFLLGQTNVPDIDTSVAFAALGLPDPPKGLHLGLERMGSPVGRSPASSVSQGTSPFYKAGEVGPTVRPLNVARRVTGPRPQPGKKSPQSEDPAESSQRRSDGPPAYDEGHDV